MGIRSVQSHEMDKHFSSGRLAGLVHKPMGFQSAMVSGYGEMRRLENLYVLVQAIGGRDRGTVQTGSRKLCFEHRLRRVMGVSMEKKRPRGNALE